MAFGAHLTSPINVLPGLRVSSSKALSANTGLSKLHERLVRNPKVCVAHFKYQVSSDINQMGKQIHIRSRASARKALSFARAVRATLQAEEQSAIMHINETEEYLGLLREKKALIELRLAEAHDQVGAVREVLDSDGIPEISLSDDEESSSVTSPPTSVTSLPTSPKNFELDSSDMESDAESDTESSVLYYSRHHDNSDNTSSSSGKPSYSPRKHLMMDQARMDDPMIRTTGSEQ